MNGRVALLVGDTEALGSVELDLQYNRADFLACALMCVPLKAELTIKTWVQVVYLGRTSKKRVYVERAGEVIHTHHVYAANFSHSSSMQLLAPHLELRGGLSLSPCP